MTAELDIDYLPPGNGPIWRGVIREGTRLIHQCPPGASVRAVPGRPGVFAVVCPDKPPYLVHPDGTTEEIP